ncbi:MAG: hypothetical protein V4492_02255 [Chlamydiota bacterium]
MAESEVPKITKGRADLMNPLYDTPQTSLLFFQFDPVPFPSSTTRLQNSAVKRASIEGKEVYLIDGFFTASESAELRNYSQNASFSRNSYGSAEAIEKGERPARSMNGKERWQFFARPPQAIHELFKLFGDLAHRMNAEITTLPWELCDERGNGSPSVIGNRLEEASLESMELGMHQDCNPENGIPFAIPVLYGSGEEVHPSSFINGDQGRPWIVSAMVYSTGEDFIPEYRMGTAFYTQDKTVALRADCKDMRLVIFEGDIFHTIEESAFPENAKNWRVSYVFKLLINPKAKERSMREVFSRLLPRFSLASLGEQSRA